MEIFKARFVQESFNTYLATPAVSSHSLIEMRRSPAHYHHRYVLGNRVSTPQMNLGTLVHLAILEPQVFESNVMVEPNVDKRTKAGKQEMDEFSKRISSLPGAIPASQEDYDTVRRIRDVASKHTTLMNLLKDGVAERSGYFTELNYNLPCKMRVDFLHGSDIIVDLKTTKDASYESFRKSVANFNYHIQAAFYVDGLTTIAGGERDKKTFIFAAIETQAPYPIAIYAADPAMIDLGRKQYRAAMATYVECKAKNEWPGYPREIKTIALPSWMYYE